MSMLDDPYEFLEMTDGETKDLKILRYELGECVITPRYDGANGSKRIKCLRIHVPPEIKPTLPQYYDITSKGLIAGLLSYLRRPRYQEKTYTIQKVGVRPTARFTLKVS